jgi:osmotically-inducible protein OsmY
LKVTSDLLWRTDGDLRDAVVYRLEWEADVNPADIGIAARDGVVTLTGFVHSYAEKLAAEHAAKHVYGVRAVTNDIQVVAETARTDADIEREAVNALRAQTGVPGDVRLTICGGVLTLDGVVDRPFQRRAAEAAVKYLQDIRGLTNQIQVRSQW